MNVTDPENMDQEIMDSDEHSLNLETRNMEMRKTYLILIVIREWKNGTHYIKQTQRRIPAICSSHT